MFKTFALMTCLLLQYILSYLSLYIIIFWIIPLKLILYFSCSVYFVSVASGFSFSLPLSNNCSMWLCLVFRVLPSAQCQVVTVRVCRSPHVVCQAVHTPQGNNQSWQGTVWLFIFWCLFTVCWDCFFLCIIFTQIYWSLEFLTMYDKMMWMYMPQLYPLIYCIIFIIMSAV